MKGKLRPASELRSMLDRNLTLRLFDAIGRHQTMMDIRSGEAGEEDGKLRTDKTELRQDYDMPRILGRDMFEECQVSHHLRL